jgi:hypothetical protein
VSEVLKTKLQRVGFDVVGTIRDAGNDLGIFINAKDIDRGKAGNPMKCTAARCLQRAVGDPGVNVAVFLHVAYVQWPGLPSVRRYIVPPKLRDKVVIPTDEREPVTPGDYTLKAPKGGERLGEAALRRDKLVKKRAEGKASPASWRIGHTERDVKGAGRWIRSV